MPQVRCDSVRKVQTPTSWAEVPASGNGQSKNISLVVPTDRPLRLIPLSRVPVVRMIHIINAGCHLGLIKRYHGKPSWYQCFSAGDSILVA
jgi:hypothetical protein